MAMTITLPEHIQPWSHRQVAEGRYESTDAGITRCPVLIAGKKMKIFLRRSPGLTAATWFRGLQNVWTN